MKKKLVWWKLVLIVLPFLVVIGWILSGLFDGAEDNTASAKGFNTKLPEANVSRDSSLDKLSFYAVAKSDSVKRSQQIQLESYREKMDEDLYEPTPVVSKNFRSVYTPVVSQPTVPDPVRAPVQMTVDPELEAINATLDKLKALQQPAEQVTRTAVISTNKQLATISTGEKMSETYFGKDVVQRSGFLGDGSPAAEPGQGMRATIPYGQVVQPGSTVRVELNSPIQINGTQVPAGTVLSGIASMNGERLQIHVPSVRVGAQVIAVQLSVYDMDGLEGIYVPGSIGRDVLKQSADGAVQSIGIGGFDASIKTQAVSAGVGAAKGLLSRKVKAIRVNLPAGYPVLLMRKNNVE